MQTGKPHKRFSISRLDALVVLILAGFVAYFAYRITIGLNYHWKWEVIPQYLLRFDQAEQTWKPGLLVQGLLTTIRLSLWAVIPATALGVVMGHFRVSPSLFRRQLAGTYVGLVRNTPPLVLIFVFYFFIGDQIVALLDLDSFIMSMSDSARSAMALLFGPPERFPQLFSALMTLAFFEGAYIAEIVRAGIESVEAGQWEASMSLGMSRYQQLRHVIMPLALQRMLPALAGQFISTIKDSAIVSVISIEELTFQGQQIMASTYRSFEVWITVLAMYFLLTFLCSFAVRRLELKMRTE